MAKRTLQEKASKALYEMWTRREFTQIALAKRMKRPQSVVNRIIHGQQPVTLDVLEAAGDLAGIDPVEMMADPSTGVKALSPQESEMLRYFRSWPHSTREALLTFLRFFDAADPLDEQLRNGREYLRTMGKAERARALAYLLTLREGGLSPDLRIAFGLPETTDEPRRKRRAGSA